MINQEFIDKIVNEITMQIMELQVKSDLIEVEASARHVHLSQSDLDALFEKGSSLTFVKELSQPNQFLSKERLTLVGPKGKIENVAILGPVRDESQVEISYADARILGIDVPLRDSGDLINTPGIELFNGNKSLKLNKGLIVAKRHIHMTKEDAKRFNVIDKEIVSVEIDGDRGLVFNNVLIRVSDKFSTRMHIDFDEANACLFIKDKTFAKILK